ncbi:MAG: hypothetical protein B5M46_02375 [Epsilonproteobacteria bacterium 4484_20]|nr:MAG: hypothetical protein B5M46_02375 [Epsilonproteobacteria bacterium 4484_20]
MQRILFILLFSAIVSNANGIKNIKSCSEGDSEACNRIGTFFEHGIETKQNLTKAKLYYNKACTLGHGAACSRLAQILKQEEDYQNASKYYFAGCRFNHADACCDLASLFRAGKGVKTDYKQAKQYYKKACSLGDKSSCEHYAYFDRNGI